MKTLLLGLVVAFSLHAQSLQFYLDTSNGQAPTGLLDPMPASYPFPDTPVGQMSSITVRLVNASASPVTLSGVFVNLAQDSNARSDNFSVAGFGTTVTLAGGASKNFFVSFTPTVSGSSSGFLQASVAGQNTFTPISALSGTGLASSAVLTCLDNLFPACDGKTPLQPSSIVPFGKGVLPDATYSIPFSLANFTSAPLPKPVLTATNGAVNAFASPELAALPDPIDSGASVTFAVIFTPQLAGQGASGEQMATLQIGNAKYSLEGLIAIDSANNNAPPSVNCFKLTGTPCTSPAGNTYALGPASDSLSALFVIENPNDPTQSFNDITLSSAPAVSNPAFVISNMTLKPYESDVSGAPIPVAAGAPVPAIPPHWALTFEVAFTGAAAGTSTLTIPYGAGITRMLNGQPAPTLATDLPGITLMCGTAPCSSQAFSSQQQVQATLQVATATTAAANLAISFTSLVSGASDPAVTFISPYNQTALNFSFGPTSLSGMLGNGQPQFTFQTGTTAGTIAFSLTDPATQQTISLPSISILPSKVQITSSTAVRQNPNLVVTITGYDNTYSVGPLSFSFTDIGGKLLTPTPISVDATSAFHQYFLGPTNQAGGAFTLQVTFPVAGDVTQVGSVTANLTNSAGLSSVSQNFQ